MPLDGFPQDSVLGPVLAGLGGPESLAQGSKRPLDPVVDPGLDQPPGVNQLAAARSPLGNDLAWSARLLFGQLAEPLVEDIDRDPERRGGLGPRQPVLVGPPTLGDLGDDDLVGKQQLFVGRLANA